jgi:transposase
MGRASKYPADLRERAVRLTRESSRPIARVARNLGIHRQAPLQVLETYNRQASDDVVRK